LTRLPLIDYIKENYDGSRYAMAKDWAISYTSVTRLLESKTPVYRVMCDGEEQLITVKRVKK